MLTPSPVPMPEPVVGFFMDNDDLRAMFLAAGLPADQVDDVLDYFQTFGRAAKIHLPERLRNRHGSLSGDG